MPSFNYYMNDCPALLNYFICTVISQKVKFLLHLAGWQLLENRGNCQESLWECGKNAKFTMIKNILGSILQKGLFWDSSSMFALVVCRVVQ